MCSSDLSVRATPTLVDRGATSILSGRLTAPTGVTALTVEAAPAGALQVVPLGSVPVAADGSFSVRVTPSSTTEYRVLVPAAGEYGEGSAAVSVSVRRGVSIAGSSPSVVRSGRVGVKTSVIGVIAPAAEAVTASFRLERWSTVARTWRAVGTLIRRTDAAGRASVSWAPKGSGLYRWRAIAASTPDYAAGLSPWVRWSIGR